MLAICEIDIRNYFSNLSLYMVSFSIGKSALYKRLRFATPPLSIASESDTVFDDELSIQGIGGHQLVLESKLLYNPF